MNSSGKRPSAECSPQVRRVNGGPTLNAGLNDSPTIDTLTAALAERVMGWRAAPDRFLKADRVWIPRWRFQPFRSIEDALMLLDAAKPTEYAISGREGRVSARVQINGKWGEAVCASQVTAITTAIAVALGLSIPQETSLPSSPLLAPGAKRREIANG